MDLEKAMQFVLERAAATEASVQKLSEDCARLEGSMATFREIVDRDLDAHTEWLTGLSQAMQELAGQMKDGFARVSAAQEKTDSNLNILITTVQDILPRLPRQG